MAKPRRIAFKTVISAKGVCPRQDSKCSGELTRIGIAEISGRDYVYAICKQDGKEKPCYLGPLEQYTYFVDKLFVYMWLAQNGYVSEESYKQIVQNLLRTIKEDNITTLEDILPLVVEILKEKAKDRAKVKEELEKKLGV